MTQISLQTPYLLHRRDSSKNMARFYCLDLRNDLFGGITLERNYGRIGTLGQQLNMHFADTASAQEALDALLNSKLRKGYQPVTNTPHYLLSL